MLMFVVWVTFFGISMLVLGFLVIDYNSWAYENLRFQLGIYVSVWVFVFFVVVVKQGIWLLMLGFLYIHTCGHMRGW
jgi:hypothetical protein